MDPDQTARMRRLVLIHAGCKPIMLVLSWRGSNVVLVLLLILHSFECRIQFDISIVVHKRDIQAHTVEFHFKI
jgi:hypothetical protein